MPCQRSLWAEVEASVHGACSAGGLLAASPKVLLFMPVGAKHAARVNHTCTTALEAGFDLFLVHYDGQKAAYEQYPWYAKAAFTAQLSHTNKFHHVAHALLRQPQLLTTVVAQYTHVLTADEDVRFPPPLALQRFAALVHAMRVPIAQPLVVKEGGGEAIVNSLSYDELRSRVDYGAIRPACDTARLVDWVETLMPIMPPCVLLELVGRYHNDAALTSYGLDMIWCRAATSLLWTRARHPPQPQPYFCAIVDGVVFVQGSANVIADYPKTSYSWNSAHSDRQCAREHAPKHCWSHLDVWGCSLGDEPHVSPPTSKWTGFVAATNPVVSARLLPAAPDADAQSVARAHFKSGAHEHEAPGGHHSRAAVTVQALAGKSPSNELIAQVGALLHPQDDYRVTSCHHGQGSKESLGRLLHEPATRAWAEYAPSASLNEWAVRMDGCITPEAGSFVPPRATKAADAGSRPAPSCCRPKRNSSQGSWVAPTVWAPRCVAEARYSWHDFAGALSCLAGRLLIFEGNSLARQLFMRLVWFLRGSPLAFEHYVHRNLGYTVTRHGDAFEMIGSSRLSPQTPEAPSDAAELRAFVAKSLNASSEQEEAFASLLFVQYGHGEYSRKLRSEWGENALAGTVVQVQDGRPVFRISGAGDGPDGGVTIDLDVMNDGNGASHYYSRNMLLVGHIDRHRWGQSVPLVHRQQYGHAKPLGTQPRMLLHEDIHFMCTFGPMWPEEVRGWKMPQNGDCRDLLNLNAVQLVLHHLCTCVRQLGPGLTLQATGEGSSSGSSAAFTRTEVSAAPVRNETHSQEPPDCPMYTPVKRLVSRPSRLQITERFASEHQQRCHRLPIRNISLCANLAVAHAGSTSLHNWLRKQGAPLAQHNHVTSYGELRVGGARVPPRVSNLISNPADDALSKPSWTHTVDPELTFSMLLSRAQSASSPHCATRHAASKAASHSRHRTGMTYSA